MPSSLPPIRTIQPSGVSEVPWKHGRILRGVEELIVELDGAHWYGMGGLLHQQWPLEKLAFPHTRFLTSDNGATGLLGLLEPFWLNSRGFGIHVQDDDLEVGFNAPREHDGRWFRDGYKLLPNADRPPLAEGLGTDGALTIRGRNLTVSLYEKGDVRQVVEAYYEGLRLCPPPPSHLFAGEMWTTWAQFKNDISHDAIVDVARSAKQHGFNPSVFGIDAKWQQHFGGTRFHPRKFPDPRGTIAALHALGYAATLWTVPFVIPDAEHYQTVVDRRLIYRSSDGRPYLGAWWEGEAVFLDFSNPDAVQWYGEVLQKLIDETGVDGFKFDAGEGKFYDVPGLVQHRPAPLNRFAERYLAPLAARCPWCDARAGWRCQHLPLLFRQWDKKTAWGFDNGLASCISQALTLNLLGYRFSFPDMIGGNEWGGDRADAELLIRWAQAAAAMPIIQFSVPPWREGHECARLTARYAALHRELAPRFERLARETLPLLRPVWWLAPCDEDALCCDDQYLVGEELLAAPVIRAGARERDVYLPPGRWRSYWQPRELHDGPGWLRSYPAALADLPLFERVAA